MPVRPASPDRAPDDERLEELVFELLERSEGEGNANALGALCAAHPEHASALREAAARLAHAGLAPVDEGSAVPERLGEFQLIRRLGSGGMGLVYLAEQAGLQRRVALKVVRPEQLYFGDARARFHREIESLARLAHPGVAAVHTSGEQDGLPYYAQEFVPGAALDTVVAEVGRRAPERLTGADFAKALRAAMPPEAGDAQPDGTFFSGSWEAVCVRIVRAAAESLQHAHGRGVLHRDVKPSNLVLCPSGRVVLIDFGLASLQEASRLTRTGSMMGSLPYMSPEHARGESVGVAADVYGLGVTLYELATLSPPFFSRSGEALRRLILDARPVALRQRNVSLSADLETICLCAMDPAPERRYADAQRFAADAAALLEKRPIAARPAGPLLRTTRWIERHPARAVAAALGTLLLVGGPVGYGLVQTRNAVRERGLNEDLVAANEQAERDFRRTLNTIDRLMRRFAGTRMVDVPSLTPVRLESAEEALELYTELLEDRPDDAHLRERIAWTQRTRGDVLHDMGRYDEAIADYDRHGTVLRELADRSGSVEPRLYWELGGGLAEKGRTLGELGRRAEQVTTNREAARWIGEAIAANPTRIGWRIDLAMTNVGLAHALLDGGDLSGAEALLAETRAAMLAILKDAPQEARAWEALGRCWLPLADLERPDHGNEERLAAAEAACNALDRGLEIQPTSRAMRNVRIEVLLKQALILTEIGNLGEAEQVVEDCERAARTLRDDFPGVPSYRQTWLEAVLLGANIDRYRGRWAAARTGMEAAARERSTLADREAATSNVHLEASASWANVANVTILSPDLEPEVRFRQSLPQLERALAHLERVSPEHRATHSGRSAAAMLHYNRALAFAGLGREQDAGAALAAFEKSAPDEAGFARYLADGWCEWALAVERGGGEDTATRAAGGWERALSLLHHAIDLGYEDRGELETTAALDPLRDDPEFKALLERLAR